MKRENREKCRARIGSGGVATAAYLDLMIRSCPRGLQGTLMMMSLALYAIITGLGNLLGTNLYEHFGGFTEAAPFVGSV